ncbi:MAG: thiamine-phosphate kinase, partial [Candidatus Saganbacteria bacterium]|nr:thiamine-phosphate kinase [Candidatus Saganbacteria bacterium]
MKLSKIGQFRLIDLIKRKNTAKGKDVIAAIGDDAAVIKNQAKNKYILLTTDSLVEGTHFDLRYSTFYELGWKLLAVNLSDIAAMGGTPKYALVTLGLKKNMNLADIDDLYAGIKALAKKHQVEIIGGDIVSSPKYLFFTMDLVGVAQKVIKRTGARPGDVIISIGRLGGSAAGLKSLKKYGRKAIKMMSSNAKAHLMPSPMVKEGQLASKFATSMIDNSDGLARCLIELCRSGNVGARIYLDKIPVAKGATVKNAFNGGEDYNLILTAPRNKAKSI